MGEHGNSSTDGGVVDYYTEGRARDAGQESFSPSGRYKLLVRYYGTKPGSWNYSRGTVWAADDPDGKPIADVKRNYSSFEFAWIEGHPNGHSYLVCGEDYQGQTVVELDTGRRRDHLPPEAKQGHAFCWIDYSFHAPTCLLVVGGCHWACPYETRFYDFRDPLTGWPDRGRRMHRLRREGSGDRSGWRHDPMFPERRQRRGRRCRRPQGARCRCHQDVSAGW